jgi:hypothetical protein
MDINEKIDIIVRQTDYTEEIAREKLNHHNMDHILVIKEFFGIVGKKEKCGSSVQQEIYKQIRLRLDDSINKYNEDQYKKIETSLTKSQNSHS